MLCTLLILLIDSGFCDSVMSPRDVLEAIKGSVKVNASYIDKVIIVCSGRIEKGHLDSIKEIMKWLKLENYQDNVALVYTKCENMNQGKKLTELSSKFNNNIKIKCAKFFLVDIPEVCDKFKLSMEKQWTLVQSGVAITPNMAVAFTPGCQFEDIRKDYENFVFAAINGAQEGDKRKRIPVDKSFCNIL